jgi:glycosyltransferase EpsD
MTGRILYVAATTSELYYDFLPLMEMMAEKGYTVEAAAYPDQACPYLVSHKSLRTFHALGRLTHLCSRSACRAYRKLKGLFQAKRYNLIHTTGTVPSLLARYAARKLSDTKVVYTAQGLDFYRGAPLIRWFTRCPAEYIASRWTDEMVTVNLEDYIRARGAFPETRVHYIPSAGVDLDTFQPMTYLRSGHKVILCIGELTHRKNQRQILKSLVHLKGMGHKFKVWFVGEGPMLGRYMRLAKRLGVEDCVEWLGCRPDIRTLLYKSDIAVSASRQEGVCRELLMAMACAKPIVATDIRGQRELVTDGVNGYAVPLHDAKAFARACAKLLNDPEILQLGAMSRIMSLKYDVEYIKHRMAGIYGVR